MKPMQFPNLTEAIAACEAEGGKIVWNGTSDHWVKELTGQNTPIYNDDGGPTTVVSGRCGSVTVDGKEYYVWSGTCSHGIEKL